MENRPTETVTGFIETKKDKIEKKIAWGILHLKKGSPEVEKHLEKLLNKAYRSAQKGFYITAEKHLKSARKYAHKKNLIPDKDDRIGNLIENRNGNRIGKEKNKGVEKEKEKGSQINSHDELSQETKRISFDTSSIEEFNKNLLKELRN